MATAAEINQLYLAYFGRPADAAGAAFFAGSTVAQITRAFGDSPEGRAIYGATDAISPAVVTSLYQNLFGRIPAASEVQLWLQVAVGATLKPAEMALQMLQGALNADQTTLGNRLAFTANWLSTYETSVEGKGYSAKEAMAFAKGLLGTIGSTATSLDGAVLAVTSLGSPQSPSAPPVGQTYTLTTGVDHIAGAATDDSIYGTADAGGTYSPTDVIDGGPGVDTLYLTGSNGIVLLGTTGGAGGASLGTLTNIERLSVTRSVSGAYNLNGFATLTDIINNGSTGTRASTMPPRSPGCPSPTATPVVWSPSARPKTCRAATTPSPSCCRAPVRPAP